jgi:hypothetical protein
MSPRRRQAEPDLSPAPDTNVHDSAVRPLLTQTRAPSSRDGATATARRLHSAVKLPAVPSRQCPTAGGAHHGSQVPYQRPGAPAVPCRTRAHGMRLAETAGVPGPIVGFCAGNYRHSGRNAPELPARAQAADVHARLWRAHAGRVPSGPPGGQAPPPGRPWAGVQDARRAMMRHCDQQAATTACWPGCAPRTSKPPDLGHEPHEQRRFWPSWPVSAHIAPNPVSHRCCGRTVTLTGAARSRARFRDVFAVREFRALWLAGSWRAEPAFGSAVRS